ncbi:putative imidazolonepropionase [Catenaria anguillulae PL171]|uniref:imidazolonepropionase n=1 Tax=Catenaria anguillulae PL171 TaxID=765915 RepID=A0A1Y2H8L1_9FUNG|nr:putative imidazolonepropionase [Catenaria anguillulae PL171]
MRYAHPPAMNQDLPAFLASSPAPAPGTAFKTLFSRATHVIPVCARNEPYLVGKAMDHLPSYADASILVGLDGRIVFVGPHDALVSQSWFNASLVHATIDCRGKSLLPGFVDGHTHPVFAGDRVNEFALKLAGATYMDIHKAGGGIGFTVTHTRNASDEQLLADLATRVSRMAKFGTTYAEAKSGYGLDTDTEVKMLRVLTRHNKSSHPVKLSVTYLGGHSVPKTKTLTEYTREILDEQIPAIVRAQEAGDVHVDNIDVFYEKGVFEREETVAVLKRGRELGWAINFHGDELHPMQSGTVGAQVGARAISHLEEVSDEDMTVMAQVPIFATLLPTTAYVLRIAPPPARKLIDAGVPALVAATINSAASLNQEKERGSLEPGKWADVVVVGHEDWRHVVYEMVDPPIAGVYVKGEKVVV